VHFEVEAYARLMADLAAAGVDSRAEVLAQHGLDEESFEAVDDEWNERLSEAMADDSEGDDGVSPLLAAYLAAFEAARRSEAPPMSLDSLALVTRYLSAKGDLRAALARVEVTFDQFSRATEYWTPRMAKDPALAARFEEVLKGRADP